MTIAWVPWLFALATAIWFGVTARRRDRAWALWGLGGAAFALSLSTIVIGLGHATAIPFTEAESHVMHVKWTVISAVLIGGLGWLITLGQRDQRSPLRNNAAESAAKTPTSPASPAADARREASKLPAK